jgi:multiple sugar transport system substrate-binding protein
MPRLSRPLSLILLFALAACQSPIGDDATTAPKATRPAQTATPAATSLPRVGVDPAALNGTVIEVWHAWTGAGKTLFESQVNEFNNSNPWKMGVRVEAHGNYADLAGDVETAFGDGSGPDLVVVLPEQARAWSDSGRVVALDTYAHDPDFGWTDADWADLPAVFLAQDTLDGRLMGLPAERSARFLFYNQTWAREIGFTTPPTDSANFREQACAGNMTFKQDDDLQNDGYGGWIVDSEPYTSLAWMTAFGGGPVQDGQWSFSSPANEKAATFIKELYDDSCAWLSTADVTWDQFARREALFSSGSLGELPDQSRAFARAASADAWTVLPFPGEDDGAFITYGPSYTVLKSSDVEQLGAWLFVRWMLSPENQADWVKAGGLLPLRSSSLAMLAEYKATHPQWAAAVELIPQAHAAPTLAGWHSIKYMLGDAFGSMFRMNTPLDQIPALLKEMDKTAGDLASGKPW